MLDKKKFTTMSVKKKDKKRIQKLKKKKGEADYKVITWLLDIVRGRKRK